MEKDVEESKNETGTTEYFNKIHVVFILANGNVQNYITKPIR
jgi:hypothetical protein